jgi:hypothetical protein
MHPGRYIRRDVMVEAHMERNSARQQAALRLTRERQRAREAAKALVPEPTRPQASSSNRRLTESDHRRLAAANCGWCDGPIEFKARGRIPKWCSAACRQRAWEQSRAAASGRSAVQIVERRVEIPAEQPARSTSALRPRHQQWVEVLDELAAQLDTGAIYDRDLTELTGALNRALEAFGRRSYVRQRAGR